MHGAKQQMNILQSHIQKPVARHHNHHHHHHHHAIAARQHNVGQAAGAYPRLHSLDCLAQIA